MKQWSMYIDGELVPAADGATELIANPATEQPIAEVPKATPADVGRAVSTARKAFESWASTTPGLRASALLMLADRIEEHAQQLAELEASNVGKPLIVARDDVEFSVDNLRFFAGASRMREGKAAGEYLSGRTSMIRREPLGVVAAIAPWNYPLLMAVWKMGPALAAGNTVVLKPSELTPLTTLRLAELSIGVLPPGVLNVVTGHGVPVGSTLTEHPEIAAVAFTGDVETGRTILRATAPGIKKVHLELGGKAPAIVFEDADLEWAAERLRRSGFYNSGQDCTAVSRLIVQQSVKERLLELLLCGIRQIRWGDPTDPETTMGPLVSANHRAKVAGMVERAGRSGGKILIGGSKPEGKGYFYLATLIADVQQTDEIVQKEVFGPVLTLQTFADEAEALRLANDISYALTGSIWTQNLGRAMRVSSKLQFGTVWINDHTRLTPEMPHGGGKSSGHGKDMSLYAMEEYTQIKHVMVRY